MGVSMEIEKNIRNMDELIEKKLNEDPNIRERYFDSILSTVRRFKKIDEKTRILEIGSGMGWFQIYCNKQNINCESIEISPELVKQSRKLCRLSGFDSKIRVGNVESYDLGKEIYDIIITMSVFEHVELWRKGLLNVFRSLKPGGILHFTSTNKFCPIPDEYPMAFYGYLPDKVRYWLRKRSEGPEIMKLGIDFNQFTYTQLKMFFKKVGFREVYDMSSLKFSNLANPTKKKAMFLTLMKTPLKEFILNFVPSTLFICKK